MLSCYHNGELYYITKLEDFKEVIDESVYECLIKYLYMNDEKDELEEEINRLSIELDDLISYADNLEDEIDVLEKENKELREKMNG